MTEKTQSPAPWVRRALTDADEARIQHAHPRMQQLHQATRLVSEVIRDHGWMGANDPDRRLEDALRVLIYITRVRRD